VDILVQLVQVGGIGGSLAFLLLGYYLLSKEQDKRDGQNNPVPPSQQIIDAIYRFLRYALVFFAVGTAVQIGMTVMQDQLRRWGQSDVAQLIFDRWYFDRPNSRAIVSFSEAAFSDSPVVDKQSRDKYDVYVGLRTRQSTRPLTGEYPVLIGPLDFGSTANQEKPVTAEQVAQFGDCVQFVLFGVEKNSVLSEPFKPASMATRPVVFNKASSCR